MKLLLGLALAAILLVIGYFTFFTSPVLALDEKGCLQCHNKPDIKKTTQQGQVISLFVNEKELDASAHRFIDCDQCHSKPHDTPAVPTKITSAEKCGACHQYERKLHRESIHGQSLIRGEEGAANCVDCHSNALTPHSVVRVLSPESPAYRRNIADTCDRCHGNEKLMTSYGILEKTYESYMRSYHGKVQTLAKDDLRKLNMATCTNCHGVHDIKKAKDPTSKVGSLANLKEACAQCHAGADENFARSFIGHEEASLKSNPAIYYIERGFLLLTASVVAGGLIVTTLAFVHYTWRRPKK
ncbi:MAG: exported protein of unknown function [Dehalococcoidia bacterium]|nr:exported protein of unknown function [Dehalococcoidia bacterium]MBF8303781.1 exported protein of unknown function [Dehalococcoidia bacterium]